MKDLVRDREITAQTTAETLGRKGLRRINAQASSRTSEFTARKSTSFERPKKQDKAGLVTHLHLMLRYVLDLDATPQSASNRSDHDRITLPNGSAFDVRQAAYERHSHGPKN